ncbi:MAG: response regulator [Phycisphaerales bacterium JB040]
MSSDRPSRILVVDDDANVLAALRRTLGRRYEVVLADGGERALEILGSRGPFPVVLTDMRMPGMDGLALLREINERYRDTVCLMLTGNADQQTAVRAINEGRIFRFLNKPCPPELLERALQDGLRQHRLVTGERELLRETLTGSVRLLIEALTLSDTELARVVSSIRATVRRVTVELGLESDWRYPLAGSLCLLGVVVEGGSPCGDWLSEERLGSCAGTGARLLRNIPRLRDVASMIERQRETGPLPADLGSAEASDHVLIGARLIRFAVDLERCSSRGERGERAVISLRECGHDERLLGSVGTLLPEPGGGAVGAGAGVVGSGAGASVPASSERVGVRELRPGMIVTEDILGTGGRLLLSAGTELTPVFIERMRNLVRSGVMGDSFLVALPREEPGDGACGEPGVAGEGVA